MSADGCPLGRVNYIINAGTKKLTRRSLPLEKIKGILLTLPSFGNRINAISQLRKRGFTGLIGTVCYQMDDEARLKKEGASFVIHPLVEAGNQLAKQLLVTNIVEE
jgi:hypothetical protein